MEDEVKVRSVIRTIMAVVYGFCNGDCTNWPGQGIDSSDLREEEGRNRKGGDD